MLPEYSSAISSAILKKISLAIQAELVSRYVDALFAPPARKLVFMFDAKQTRLWCQTAATQPQLAEVLAFAAATASPGSKVSIVLQGAYEFKIDGLRGGYQGLDEVALTCCEKGVFDLELRRAGSLKEIELIECLVEPFDKKSHTPSQRNYLEPQADPFEAVTQQMKARRIKQRDEWIVTGVILITIVIIVIYSIFITR